ncbi:MAG: hypothetical protein HY821_13785 [Acidobacteria bacterium]|nr:hypothetical protein [Acidobacteriota bacterium]
MTEETLGQLERVAAAGIEMIPAAEVGTHFLFAREGCVVLVERRGAGFGGVGSPGKLVESGGFAALVRRGEEDWWVGKGGEEKAEAGQAEAARRLFTDLKAALTNRG